ncbi:MAG: Rrf2 family transcriptional regulator [Candidatus Moranbacteria bacterium]|nr:Rrf2 family transcriptional regulator [Candidatus Moranbacteria bacterium]
MKFSTKAEYGLKAMVNLAKDEAKIKNIKLIAKEESISIKYLERLLNVLRKYDLVDSFKGTNGGYALKIPAKKISVADIVIALEGPIAPMKCVGKVCKMEHLCSSKVVWEILGIQIEKTLRGIKLSDLVNNK